MDPLRIIDKYYGKSSKAREILIKHGNSVLGKALEIAKGSAKEFDPDIDFIKEASLLHDIGMFLTWDPAIGCFGGFPYLCHGYLGRDLLEKEGYTAHGLVCERHIGVGITKAEVERKNLPLPKRDMIPLTVEEEIVCLADKFFSKSSRSEKSIDEIADKLSVHGKAEKFRALAAKYGLEK